MSNITTSGLANDLGTIRNDPTLVQTRVLELIEYASNGGLVVVDPNNPFALGLEMATTLAVNNITEARLLTRKVYPSLANTLTDIYSHMTDYDYRDIYTNPSRATFVILLDKEEALSKTVQDPSVPSIRKLTIPRYTRITVADADFTLLYPIDITLSKAGGIQITYDNSSPTRLQPLSTNLLRWDVVNMGGRDTIRIEVTLYQLTITRFIPQLNSSQGFSRPYSFEHNFHYCRAFIKNSNNAWQEIVTTHSNKVIDPKKPTVVLTVNGKEVRVEIPQIYFNSRLITDAVRLDFYTTRGPMSTELESLDASAFSTSWDTVANEKLSIFSAPMLTLTRFAVYSTDTITGGTPPMSQAEIRRRVINRSLNTEGLPITHQQLNNKLNDLGYKLVTNIDNITDRQYLATKRLPPPFSGRTVTGISASIATLEKSMVDLELSRHVVKNSIRDTIKPTMLYELIHDQLKVLSDTEEDHLRKLRYDSPETFVDRMNNRKYLYSPYYYVLDSNSDEFGCRIYDLDNPTIKNRYFKNANTTLGATLAIADYNIRNSPNKDGYYLEVQLVVGDIAKTLGHEYIDVQLSYKGRDSANGRFWINGVLITPIDEETGKPINDEYLYRFHIETRYDVDEKDGLIPIPYKAAIDLEHEFDICTILRDFVPDGYQNTNVDELINPELLKDYKPNSIYVGMSHEQITLNFGYRLKHLWGRTRTIVDFNNFDVYDADEIDRYTSDVYEYDDAGNPVVLYDKDTGGLALSILHRKGDRKLDQFGDTIYKHRKGDVKLDEDGEPLLKGGRRGQLKHIDIFLLDARYLFSEHEKDIAYKNYIRDMVTDWCVNDMSNINNQLLERSEIFFFPMRTTGRIDVLADDNQNVSIQAEQQFVVTYWLTKTNHVNTTLRDAIERQTVITLQHSLSRDRSSIDSILDDLRLAMDGQIVAVTVDGFTNGRYSTVTVKDGSVGLSVGKRLHVMSNNILEVRNDVTVIFKVHGE